ncbi:FAD-binding oxidoreductase [Robertkochia marina]|uniref:FAD-binding oxidoreductase n=1 Tax=Robertkochia marina TaxID=1227945 RepID=A0A4S3M1V8_9FLAO|nr:FAD-binding oxidoreductase [Robertkochia marina]THD68810.1 FAD-binding oxidoreductase [Robertkochia marina]TRZ43884.1 FAD-binding oxidoreductase [Robertkochia marina]
MTDYIIVGCGLAGIAFCEELRKQGKSFVVYDDRSQVSSHVAGGMYNPVILKRFTPVWRAGEQLGHLDAYYKGLEEKLGVTVDTKLRLFRRFVSVEEQNEWFHAADNPLLEPYMNTSLHHMNLQGVEAPHGFGEVLHTGWVNTRRLQESYMALLEKEGLLKREAFDYHGLEWVDSDLRYKDIPVKHVVFCEGYGIKHNPYFNYLPLNGTKGEVLEVEIPGLDVDFILKSSVFLLPLGGHRYKVGATYKWKDKTNEPTEECRVELLEKLERFLKLPYKVVNHQAGIRPTVADRRPLLGTHPENKGLHILNGLGSRGVMIAPWVAPLLYQSIENGEPVPVETNIERFKKRWLKNN